MSIDVLHENIISYPTAQRSRLHLNLYYILNWDSFKIFKKLGERYPDDLLLMERFRIVQLMDTVRSHEATQRVYECQSNDATDAVGHMTT